MRNKDTGEFELVVGDKQLLLAFFIGILLLGVVFAMGYVVGQSTPKSAKVATPETTVTPANTAEARPPTSTTAAPPSTEPAANPPAQTADTSQAAAPPVEPPPQPTTVPARDANTPAPPAKAQPAPAIEPAPANCCYWQVLAGSQNSAEALSQSLKGKGFPVVTRPGPNSLTLVWVGPYPDKEALGHAKKQLEDAGITNLYRKP